MARLSHVALMCGLSVAIAARIATPHGGQPEECVIQIPTGTHVHRVHDQNGTHTGDVLTFPNGTRKAMGRCQEFSQDRCDLPPQYDGWVAYTKYKHSSNMNYFYGKFSVPNVPAERPEKLYLFTALQNIDWVPKVDHCPQGIFDIIQPVLQYPAYDGNGWSIVSWMVNLGGGYTYHTDDLHLAVGDYGLGNMTQMADGKWWIGSGGSSTSKVVGFTASGTELKVQPWAYTTAECYGCSSCQTYPTNSCNFVDMVIKDASGVVTPTWDSFTTPTPVCGEKATIQTPEATTLSFQKSQE